MEFEISKIKMSNYDKKRGLVLPNVPSQELAEFIGNINWRRIHESLQRIFLHGRNCWR